jgi:hypothetical protein
MISGIVSRTKKNFIWRWTWANLFGWYFFNKDVIEKYEKNRPTISIISIQIWIILWLVFGNNLKVYSTPSKVNNVARIKKQYRYFNSEFRNLKFSSSSLSINNAYVKSLELCHTIIYLMASHSYICVMEIYFVIIPIKSATWTPLSHDVGNV